MGIQSQYPGEIWDGSSGNRDTSNPVRKSPDNRDWVRMTGELQATQRQIDSNAGGIDPDPIYTIGTLPAVSGLSVVERGNAAMHKTILTLDQVVMVTTDGTTPLTDGAWGVVPVYMLPKGHPQFLGSHAAFSPGGLVAQAGGGAGLSDTADFEIGIGTVAAAQDSSFGLSGAEETILAGITAALVGGANAVEVSAVNGTLLTSTSHDIITVYLNLRTLADDDHGPLPDALLISGDITFTWSNLGDD